LGQGQGGPNGNSFQKGKAHPQLWGASLRDLRNYGKERRSEPGKKKDQQETPRQSCWAIIIRGNEMSRWVNSRDMRRWVAGNSKGFGKFKPTYYGRSGNRKRKR